MCGRTDIHTPPGQLARRLGIPLAKDVDPEGDSSWNVAPTRGFPVVMERASPGANGTQGVEGPCLYVFHWGLLPYWAKTPTVGYKMINAKAETLATSAAYRIPFRQRRCLVVADGFYEWHPSESGKLKRKNPLLLLSKDAWTKQAMLTKRSVVGLPRRGRLAARLMAEETHCGSNPHMRPVPCPSLAKRGICAISGKSISDQRTATPTQPL